MSARDESLGKMVRSRRKSLGMEQQTLATETKISPRTIRDIENGNPNNRTRRTSTIERLLTTLGFAPDTFERLGMTADDQQDDLVEHLLNDAKANPKRRDTTPVTYPIETFIDAFELNAEAANRLRSSIGRRGGLLISDT